MDVASDQSTGDSTSEPGAEPTVWSRTTRRGSAGALAIGGIGVHRLAARFGTPTFILDEADFRHRCREFRAAFAGARVFYGAKAFLCRAVASMAHEEGLGIDVCSGGELSVALAAGVPAESLALHGNNKSPEEIDRAVAVGVGTVVLDSREEIGRITVAARRHGRRQRVMIRVTPGLETDTHDYIATAHDDVKFGFSMRSGAAEHAIATVLAEPALELRGLHCHLGSQIFDASRYEVAATRLLALYDEVGRADGRWWPELDLGGGFGIAYTAADCPLQLRDIGANLTKVIAHECAARRMPTPMLVIEPGRSIVGPSMLTLYRVGTVKVLSGLRTYVSVDGGMSDNIRTALYGARYTAVLAGRRSDAPLRLSRIVGKHCESGDILVRDVELPSDVRPGDLVAIAATGAYCRSMASNYNHVLRPPVVAVANRRARRIVRRETEADLLALDMGR